MEPDCYKVDILHYLNPHLIWVEVVDSKRDAEFVFEQIGVYGLLPYEITLQNDGEGLQCQRSPEWVAASTAVMKKSLIEAKEVFFRPTFIDRRSSIFDDNIHKYGEIIIKTVDGAKFELTDVLVDSGFALYDICLFHKELSLGNLKTKLTNVQARDVIKHLEKDNNPKSRSSVKKQTTVFQAAQNFETILTTQNLERHNRQLSGTDVDNLVMRKMKDFDRCKEIDEESVGRAIHSRQNVEENKPSLLLKKKLELLKLQQSKIAFKEQKKDHNDPLKVLLATKKFLEQNAKQMEEADSNISGNSENKLTSDEVVSGSPKSSWTEETPNYAERSVKKLKKSPKQPKIPEYNVATEKRVAYGPPGTNLTQLPLKIVPKEISSEDTNLVSAVDDRKEVVLKDKEPFADVDSHVNIEITNKGILKEKLKVVNENTDVVDNNTTDTCQDDSFDLNSSVPTTQHKTPEQNNRSPRFAMLQKKLKLYKEMTSKKSECSATSHSDTTNKDSSTSDDVKPNSNKKQSESLNCCYLDSDDDLAEIMEKINEEYPVTNVKPKLEAPKDVIKAARDYKNNVNPFKNVDDSISVFVDKLVAPVLMVHSKMDKRFEPCSNIRDVNFNTHIHVVLKNMSIERPMMLQMISWPVILRGFSLFMISPLGSGKTLGYLPAVCRLVTDFNSDRIDSVGPTCIIVCATAQAVAEVERLAQMFLGLEEKVFACYAGMDELHVTTSLLNGCDLFICTPSVLVRLLQVTDFGIDLRRLSTFVLDDCERLSEVYAQEIKLFLSKIKKMYKQRVNKEFMVQFVVASRVWCDFMEPLVKKTPNSVVCISAFQECVLYSKTNTVVDFVKKENKIKHVLEFLKDIDSTKKTVIICRSDEEVVELNKVLLQHKYVVFACNSTMTVEELYNLSKSWVEYEEPLLGPILIACDGNLTHLNATDAHYLIHYSLPQLFSMFCKRFSVLNDNYSSVFKDEKQNVKIKVFLEEGNVEQLPKILNFIKRCTDNVPEFLGTVSEKILQEKDVIKGRNHVPICDTLLALGECPDFWNCLERHSVLNEFDQPKDWMPKSGVVTFKILHYHTAIHYSARLLSNSTKGTTKKYPQTYSMLSLKIGMFFSKESNRKLHGIPKVGDVCAVSIKQNFFARCQVLKILNYYNNGTPNYVLIKLIDEEKLERTRDIYLYYLPNDLREVETHIVQVRLANIRPKDKDVTFSDLAKNQLKKITDKDEDLYMRGQVLMTIGNCVFVDTLDACQELTSLNEIVVRYNFKKELLETHAIPNPDHMVKLNNLCKDFESLCRDCLIENEIVPIETTNTKQKRLAPKAQWAHLEKDDFSQVFFSSAENPGTFFVRLTKFEPCMKSLLKEIDNYVAGKPTPIVSVEKGDILLAKFPDDDTFERARVDEILKDGKVKCFFVDHGDWSVVFIKDLLQIPEKLISLMPFQAIECSLVGIKPAGEDWTEFGTNWFTHSCFETKHGDIKQLYVKYFRKEKAIYTNGHKYSVVLIDTTTDEDVLINQLMIDLNLAQAKEDELHFFNELNVNRPVSDESSSDVESFTKEDDSKKITSLVPVNTPKEDANVSLNNVFLKKPIRSVPLVDSDNETDDSDKWEIVNPKEVMSTLIPKVAQPKNENIPTVKPYPTPIKTPVNVPRSTPVSNPDTAKTTLNKLPSLQKVPKSLSSTLDSDDLSSAEGSQLSEKVQETKILPNTEIDELRKPRLVWRQNKTSVCIKIQLIGAEDYHLEIKERALKFRTNLNDTDYGFDFELYGVIETKSSSHSNKGQYILVKLTKIIKKNWLTLTKDGSIRKWIVYDVDSIDTSSDEEEEVVNHLANMVKHMHNTERDSESDDDLLDDINFEYKRDSD